MTVLDAYALHALLMEEPASREVVPLLQGKERSARIASVNLAEVYDNLIRGRGERRTAIDQVVNPLIRARRLSVVPVDDAIARRAGDLRGSHYHRTRRPVSIADCIATATSEALSEDLATSDPHLASMAHEEGVEVVALPDSRGHRPEAE